MSGWDIIDRIRILEHKIDQLGCKLISAGHNDWVSVVPEEDDSLPVYNRYTALFTGTLEDLECWVKGVDWARRYDQLIDLSDDGKRARKEQDVRNQQLMQKLKDTHDTEEDLPF